MVDPRNLSPPLPALKVLIDGKSGAERGSLPVGNPATGQRRGEASRALDGFLNVNWMKSPGEN